MKKALITGITGQDGSYLTEILLAKGYEVHGVIRKASTFNTGRLREVYQDPHEQNRLLHLHYGDLADASMLSRLLARVQPDEIYNLGAQSHVRVSFDIPEYTSDVVALGPLRILEAVRDAGIKPRFYQASSSEMFGGSLDGRPLNEESPFLPKSPYAAAKCFGFHMTRLYREAYGVHAVNGILFNHESPRRGATFVTRKITMAVARILAGKEKKVFLGNLDAKRDWGYAPEYMEAAWRMMQQPQASDYVIATGETHSVREFLDAAFSMAGLDWREHVEIDDRYIRPMEVDVLVGDASKAKRDFGFEPAVTFRDLIRIMLDADCRQEGACLPS